MTSMGKGLSFVLLMILLCIVEYTVSQRGKRSCRIVDGFDISSAVTVTQFENLKRNYSFFITRAFRSTGVQDTNAQANINNGRQAGFTDIDIYMFPCPKCSATAAQQVNTMLSGLTGFSRIWLDIEDDEARTYWPTTQATNQQFFQDLITALKPTGHPVGVYTSENNWSRIMGCIFTDGSIFPLWYPRYNGIKIFDDFRVTGSINPWCGGWTKSDVLIKQYQQNVMVHGVNLNHNWKRGQH